MMNSLELVKLTALMDLTSCKPEITIGLMDGLVVVNHPDLAGENLSDYQIRITNC